MIELDFDSDENKESSDSEENEKNGFIKVDEPEYQQVFM